VVVDLQSPPEVEPFRLLPGPDGTVDLPVFLAEIQSEMGQRAYLDYFFRTTMLANWQNVNDYPVWEFETAKPGTYEIRTSYASVGGGPADFVIEADDLKVTGRTESSPSGYFPKTFAVGKVELGAGKHTLKFRIANLTNNHALNLEKVVLVPAGR